MCSSCFEIQYESFASAKEWQEFDWLLKIKVGTGKLKYLSENEKDEYTYECLNCKQQWKLKEPDNDSRGYFLKTT
jgi:hypothetical protein